MNTINWKELPVEDYGGVYLYAQDGDDEAICHEFCEAVSLALDDPSGGCLTMVQMKRIECTREDGERYAIGQLLDDWAEWWVDEGYDYDGYGDDGMTAADIEALKKIYGDIAERSAPNRAEDTGLLIEVTPDYWEVTP